MKNEPTASPSGEANPDKATRACCYAPNGNFCGAFLPTETSATLETGYHYGSGGDAVLIVEAMTNRGIPTGGGSQRR